MVNKSEIPVPNVAAMLLPSDNITIVLLKWNEFYTCYILSLILENNNPIISTADINVVEIRNIDLILEESSSASSDNGNNASGHVDDGYEKPYTTLLVLNPVEITHDYLTTKRKYSNENPAIFATDAFGTTSMYETKTLDHPNARYENVNLKSDANKADYINLSLKQ